MADCFYLMQMDSYLGPVSHVAPGMQEAAALKLDEELTESRVSSLVVISG